MQDNISNSLIELEEDEVLEGVSRSLEQGVEPITLVEQLRLAMSVVGKRFEDKEYYLSELIMSAEIFKEAMELIEPRLGASTDESRGRLVIGTVKGDIHDIGKNIVATLLRCEGFEVLDLGVDVPAAVFVEETRSSGAKILALSGLLTPAFDAMKETVAALTNAGLRDDVKVIIGGGPVNQSVVEFAGADAWGKDAAQAVRLVAEHLA
jgi:methanogenic corrinoid protein MtbC1